MLRLFFFTFSYVVTLQVAAQVTGSAYGVFTEAPASTGQECLLDTRRTRGSNRLQLTGQLFGREGSDGYVSAVFSGPSTKGMDEANTTVKVVFGEVTHNNSETLLEHTQPLFMPSDIVSVATYTDFPSDKELRHHLNIYITFTPSQLASANIDFVPGRFYFLEVTLEKHYKSHSLKCHRVDVIYTGPEASSEQASNFNVMSFGALGNGQKDDTTSIQSAINAAAAVGGTVFVPPGHYSITASLELPAGVTLVGAGLGANPRDMTGMKGSIIMYRGLSFAMVLQGDLIEVKNLVVYDNGKMYEGLMLTIKCHAYCCFFILSVTM